MLPYRELKMVYSTDLDRLVEETYKKPYCFQQQAGIREKGDTMTFSTDKLEDLEEEGTVGLKEWLETDPDDPIRFKYGTDWVRGFYPSLEEILSDLVRKGLVVEGEYMINITF